MNKINLLEHIYECDDQNTQTKLNDYLQKLQNIFGNKPEVLRDIELSIVEQFDEMLRVSNKNCLSIIDVDFVIQKMGEVENIESDAPVIISEKTSQQLYRDYENRIIGGVCAGISAYFNLSPWIVRLVALVCAFFIPPTIFIYLLMWYLIPPAMTKAEQLNMRGIPVNIASIANTNIYTRKKIINIAKLMAVLFAFSMFVLTMLMMFAIYFKG